MHPCVQRWVVWNDLNFYKQAILGRDTEHVIMLQQQPKVFKDLMDFVLFCNSASGISVP